MCYKLQYTLNNDQFEPQYVYVRTKDIVESVVENWDRKGGTMWNYALTPENIAFNEVQLRTDAPTDAVVYIDGCNVEDKQLN